MDAEGLQRVPVGVVPWTIGSLAALYRAAGLVEFQRLPSAALGGVPVTEVGYQLGLG
ncbi:MAG: hypothetical protein ACRDQ5_06870 [Sciscionella sp.]